jgi:hypothetical protein
MQNLQSLGHACGQYQRSVSWLRSALDLYAATPKLCLNGVAYYAVDDIEMAVLLANDLGRDPRGVKPETK